ncbi:phage tailspike protein [Escherichia albertii]|uniref:phage tailspike protein n=1 Tax=Escherichia albertii TaxID=208962 RepID=UPI00379F3090
MTDITANVVVSMPSQLFTMARSFKAVANGKIYIGKIDTDPVNPDNQIQVYVENEDGSHVPVAQPIVINAAGYPVYNGQIAKFVTVQGHSMAVYDAYGAQQFYFPNVLKYDPDQLRNDLSSGSNNLGDNLVAVKQPFPLVMQRTQHDFNADYINVKDWGAKGDGVTDDTNAIDAACAALTGTSLVTNFRRLYLPHGTYIYNGAGITLPSGTTICGEDLFTIIDASNNANSGYLVTLVGFGARLETLRLKGNASNANLKGISSAYNSDNGGVVDAILEDFHYGIDIDKCWYSVYQNIRFRRSGSSVVLTGSHIRIGYNQPTEEVNNVNFSNIWMTEQQAHSVTVHCKTQTLTWNECSFETKGQSRIYFATAESVNTFTLNSCYIEGDVESSSYPYLVEGQTVNQVITCNDCMFRLGNTVSSLGKNITINLNGGWSNSPNVALQSNNTKVWMSNYRYLGTFSDAPNYSQSGDYDGSAMHSASAMMSPRPMDIRDWNSVIPHYVNYKTHQSTSPVDIFKIYIPIGSNPRQMLLNIKALTKSTSETYIQGVEEYMLAITLPETSTPGTGTYVAKLHSSSKDNATLLSDMAFSITSNGYDSTTDAYEYTISHSVSNSTRLGTTTYVMNGVFTLNGLSTTTPKWRIRRL